MSIMIDFGEASSSKIPRFELIPRESLVRLASRFELGIVEHKERAWNALSPNQECLRDRGWVLARAAHAINHAYIFIDNYSRRLKQGGDDDAAAIMWAGACLCEATKISST